MRDHEEFCPRCAAGVDSDEHHGKCVVQGFADDGYPAEELCEHRLTWGTCPFCGSVRFQSASRRTDDGHHEDD